MNEQEYLKYLKAVKNYKTARYAVLIAIIITAINMVAVFFKTYFFTSICLSTLFFNLGLFWKNQAVNSAQSSTGNIFLIIGIAIGIAILVLVALFYRFSKNKAWAIIVLTSIMAVDTVSVPFVSFSGFQIIPDLLFHCLMLFVLIRGVKSAKDLERDFDDGIMTSAEEITEIYNLLNSRNIKSN